MSTTTILAALLIVAFAALGAAKIVAVPAMRSRAEHVGFTVAAYRRIGALEILGVVGVLVGVAVPAIGALAGTGLLLLLGGAVATHVRNGDGPKEIAPAVALGAIALTYVVMIVGRLS